MSKKRTTTIYTDASYTMGNNFGRIAFKINGKKVHIKDVKIPKISYLKQYTNLLELTAVLEALKYTKAKRVKILTDSQCIRSWVRRTENDLGQFSKFHKQLKDKTDKRKKEFKHFDIQWVRREENLAGIALENI